MKVFIRIIKNLNIIAIIFPFYVLAQDQKNKYDFEIIYKNYKTINKGGDLTGFYYDTYGTYSPNVRCKGGKWGVLDTLGNEILPAIYDFIKCYDRFIYVNVGGETEIHLYGSNYNKRCIGGRWGVFDEKKKEIIPIKHEEIFDASEGEFKVWNLHKYGFIDTTGKEIAACKYDFADSFYEGLAHVSNSKKHGFIDKSGKEVISLIYDDAGIFYKSDDLCKVKVKDKFGFIDKKGNLLIPLKYDDTNGFSEGLAQVKKNKKYGYIDKNDKVIIPFLFDFADDFIDGTAKVKIKDRKFYIDKNGNEVKLGY